MLSQVVLLTDTSDTQGHPAAGEGGRSKGMQHAAFKGVPVLCILALSAIM